MSIKKRSNRMHLSAPYFQKKLLRWFHQHGRKSLPWQENKTPYRVWISEIMLQQTQVATVIPYFERFMRQFPDLATLAKSHEDKVLHCWAGLGYYSRARYLHRTAKIIMEKYAGKFPDTLVTLQTLPGIGASTGGAILAIAFNQSATILDGNVKRVLARFHGITEPINTPAIEEQLWTLAEHYTPNTHIADYTQAIMDLGATVCTRRKPQCTTCPFNKYCIAYQQGIAEQLPQKKAVRELPTRLATFLVLKKNKQILLHKRPASGIWGGLWSFPEMTGAPEKKAIRALCRQQFQLTAVNYDIQPWFRHTFSHYHLHIYPVIIAVKKIPSTLIEKAEHLWYNPRQPASIGLPKPVQFILGNL